MSKKKRQSQKQVRKPGKIQKNSFQLKKTEWLPLLIVLGVTFIAFFPAIQADFVNWDDDYNILKNDNLLAFNFESILGIFTSHVIGNYNPLPIFTFAIEKAIFGLNPTVFHMNNILLHLVCVYFIYRIFRMLNLPMIPALAGALLFGIHPMRVESVAWITERKDVLFGAFYLAAIYQYIKFLKSKKTRKYFYYAMIFAVFALLSKIQAVSLPLTFLAIDYYLKRPLKWNLIIEKIPFFALSLMFGLIGFYFLGEQGSLDDQTAFGFGSRLLIGAHTLGIYLLKFVFPFKMSPLYPYPASVPSYMYIAPLYVFAFAGLFFIAWKKEWRALAFGLAFFLFNVMFMLQIIGAGQGFLADRFTYIPYAGLFFTVVYYLHQLALKKPANQKVIWGIFGAYLLLFAGMTFKQSGIWKNSETLWTHVMKHYTETPLPFRNRANYYRDEGRFDEAMADYNQSISIKADHGVYNSRAKLFFSKEQWGKAIEDYNMAIKLKPENGEYRINRGAARAALGQYDAALKDLSEGIERDPGQLNGYKNRSLIYQVKGQYQLSLQDFETFLSANPYDSDMWYEKSRVRRILKQPGAAVQDLNRAIQLNPNNGIYFLERSRAHFESGNKGAALQDAQTAQNKGAKVDAQYLQSLRN